MESDESDTSDKKIAVIGIGATGSVIVRKLWQKRVFGEIVCIDKNPKRAMTFIEDIKGEKGIKIVKAGNLEKIERKLAGASLIINAATYNLNIPLMNMALKIKAHYLDLGSRNNCRAEQLKLNSSFVKKGLRALINFGLAPGLTNILARELTEGADWAKVKIFVAEHTKTNQIFCPWNAFLALDEALSPVPVFENWRYRRQMAKPFSQPEKHNFPPPIGEITCYLLNENEITTIPRTLKNIRSLSVKCGGADIEALKFFLRSNGNNNYSVRKLARFMPPTPNPKELKAMLEAGLVLDGQIALMVEAIAGKGKKTSKKKGCFLAPSLKKIQKIMPGANHISYATGTLAALGADIIFESDFSGVRPPECLSKKERVFVFESLSREKMPVHF